MNRRAHATEFGGPAADAGAWGDTLSEAEMNVIIAWFPSPWPADIRAECRRR